MLWCREDDWVYELYPLDEPSETFPGFETILRLWRAKSRNDSLPKWSDFEMMDFEGWWGWINVYDFHGANRERLLVRLWGSRIAEICGFDLTGRELTPSGDNGRVDAQHITKTDIAHHRAAAEKKQIAYSHGPVKVEYRAWKRLYDLGLPLAEDGEYVDKILYATLCVNE